MAHISKFKLTFCFQFFAFLLLIQNAEADLILNFSTDGGNTFTNSIDLLVDETVNVGFFLSDPSDDNQLSTVGLGGFGVTANLNNSSLGMISDATEASVFDFPSLSNSTSASSFTIDAAVLTSAPPTGTSILLGTFDFTSNATGTSVVSFSDPVPGTGTTAANFTLGDFITVLDEDIFGPGATGSFQLTINATAVPEPGLSGTLGVALIVVLTRRRRG